MIEAGIWICRKRRIRHRQYRQRRDCPGELIQLDGSIHDWFEGRAEKCVLLTYIDDASSRILHSEFVACEDTINLMRASKNYLQKCGRPVAFYVDRDSIFRVNRQATIEEQLRDSQPMTQFSRAMEELGIEVIFANSPQAKGRVERGFKTHQDRLVKELRLNVISSLSMANDYLQQIYIPCHNARFAVKPANPSDAHRPLLKMHRLDEILSLRTERTLANDFTVRFKNTFFQILPDKKSTLRPKAKVTLEIRIDGSLQMKHRGTYLPYKLIEKSLPTISNSLRIGSGNRIPHQPANNHPWKNFVISHKHYNFR